MPDDDANESTTTATAEAPASGAGTVQDTATAKAEASAAPATAAEPADDRRDALKAALRRASTDDDGNPLDASAKPEPAADPKEPTPEPEPKEPDAEAEGDAPPPETPAGKPDKDALEKARAAMKRSQYPDDVIAGLSESRVLEIGGKLAERETEISRRMSEYGRFKQMFEQHERERARPAAQDPAKQTAAPTGDTAGTAAASTPPALSERVKAKIGEVLAPLVSEENAAYYGDLKEPLAIGFTTVAEAIASEYAAKFAAVEAKIEADAQARQADQLRYQQQQFRLAATEPDLLRDYPEIKDPRVLADVRQRAWALARADEAGVYYPNGSEEPDWDALARDAASLVIKRDPLKQTQARMATRQREVAQSQPERDGSGRFASGGKPLSTRDALKLAARELSAGKTADEVARRLRSA